MCFYVRCTRASIELAILAKAGLTESEVGGEGRGDQGARARERRLQRRLARVETMLEIQKKRAPGDLP